jgi:hypothetical protein
MGTSKRYVKDSILAAMRAMRDSGMGEWFRVHQLRAPVSERVGIPVSSQRIARHLMIMEEDREVECDRSRPYVLRWRAIG